MYHERRSFNMHNISSHWNGQILLPQVVSLILLWLLHSWLFIKTWSSEAMVKVLHSQSKGSKPLGSFKVDPAFHLSRSINWVSGTPWDLVVKIKLPPHNGSAASKLFKVFFYCLWHFSYSFIIKMKEYARKLNWNWNWKLLMDTFSLFRFFVIKCSMFLYTFIIH